MPVQWMRLPCTMKQRIVIHHDIQQNCRERKERFTIYPEAINGKKVEDTLLTSLEVPIQQVVGSMSTKEQNYKGTERVKLVVNNEQSETPF